MCQGLRTQTHYRPTDYNDNVFMRKDSSKPATLKSQVVTTATLLQTSTRPVVSPSSGYFHVIMTLPGSVLNSIQGPFTAIASTQPFPPPRGMFSSELPHTSQAPTPPTVYPAAPNMYNASASSLTPIPSFSSSPASPSMAGTYPTGQSTYLPSPPLSQGTSSSLDMDVNGRYMTWTNTTSDQHPANVHLPIQARPTGVTWVFYAERCMITPFEDHNQLLIEASYQRFASMRGNRKHRFITLRDIHLPYEARIYFGVDSFHLRMPGTRYRVRRQVLR